VLEPVALFLVRVELLPAVPVDLSIGPIRARSPLIAIQHIASVIRLLLLRGRRDMFRFRHRFLQSGGWSGDRMSMDELGIWEKLRRNFPGNRCSPGGDHHAASRAAADVGNPKIRSKHQLKQKA
jgi:hypothetical protein